MRLKLVRLMAPTKSMNWDALLGLLLYLYNNPMATSWAIDALIWTLYVPAMFSFQGKQGLVHVRFFC